MPTGSMEKTMLVGERFFADKFTPLFIKPKHKDIIAFNDPVYPYSKNKIVRLFQEYVWGPSNWTKRVIAIPGDHIKGVIEDGKPVVYLNGKKLDEPYINQYPLIREWKVDHTELMGLIRKGISEYQLAELIVPKTYDPHKPFNDQPFYRIDPNKVHRLENGEPWLVHSGTALEPREKKDQSVGKDYWSSSDEFDVHLKDNQYWLMGDNRLGSKDSRFLGPVDGRLIHGKIRFRIWSIDSYESWWIVDLIKNPIDFFKRVRWSRFFQIIR